MRARNRGSEREKERATETKFFHTLHESKKISCFYLLFAFILCCCCCCYCCPCFSVPLSRVRIATLEIIEIDSIRLAIMRKRKSSQMHASRGQSLANIKQYQTIQQLPFVIQYGFYAAIHSSCNCSHVGCEECCGQGSSGKATAAKHQPHQIDRQFSAELHRNCSACIRNCAARQLLPCRPGRRSRRRL